MSASTSNYVLRPAALADLDAIVALVGSLTDSLTSLPQEPDFILRRIHKSMHSFYPHVDAPGSEQYLFVLDGPDGVVGISAIIARVGGYQPFYTFEITHEDFTHGPLGIAKKIPTLSLKLNHDGPSEIGSLYLHPNHRRDGLGRLLSLGRFLFMAQFPHRFRGQTLAELRGHLDENGDSPFWQRVGKPFFETEFTDADFLSGLGNKSFIRDLMPRHPFYTNLLPPDVQEVIGRVHHQTEPAKALIEAEGFSTINEVDIFDAGPILQAETRSIRTIAARRNFRIAGLVDEEVLPGTPWHAANRALEFRACIARAEVEEGKCLLSSRAAQTLQLGLGDTVQLAPARSPSAVSPS